MTNPSTENDQPNTESQLAANNETAATSDAVPESSAVTPTEETAAGVELTETESSSDADAAVDAGSDADAESDSDSDSSEEESSTGEAGDAPKKKKRRKKKKKAAEPRAERSHLRVGEEVFGQVLTIDDVCITIDLGGKATGIFDRLEMEEGDEIPEVGARFVASVLRDDSRGGLVVLTRKPLRDEETKPFIEAASKSGELILGLITGVIKGGVEVDIGGCRAFAPATGVDLHPSPAKLKSLVGTRIDFKISQYDNAGKDIVVTRRAKLEAEAHERRKAALTNVAIGQVMPAVVRTVVDWGVFVSLPEAEGLEGLIHMSEAAHHPRPRLNELFRPGQRFPVEVLKIDQKGKLWLSRKSQVADPWLEAKEKFAPGSIHRAKVTTVENFGIFLQLVPGIEGLLHASDFEGDRSQPLEAQVKSGDEYEVQINHLDLKQRKLSLFLAPPEEQRNEARQKVAKYAILDVVITEIEDVGLQVRIKGTSGRSARGFIPASQTGTERGAELKKSFEVGQTIKAKVIDQDERRGNLKLSVRALAQDEERKAHREYRKQLETDAHFGTLGALLKAAVSTNKS